MDKENRIKPKHHVTPKTGFLNDPNGLVQFKGTYHAFYQWLEEVTPQGAKCWRHCISKDLVNWEDKGIALKPDMWYDKNGCYSGNGIVFNEKIYLFYTGNVRKENGDRETYQCLATSEDGITFQKHGPVIYLPEGYTAHFRDPKVWKDEEEDIWWMIVGAQTSEKKGNVALFWSEDLYNWNYKGNLLPETMNWGYMCECPDMIRLGEEYILIVSRQEKKIENGIEKDSCHAVWMSGEFSKEKGTFTPHKEGIRVDEGFDFYAPQSFIDENKRTLYMSWMGGGEYDYQMSQLSVNDGWLHSFTYPREFIYKNNWLYQKPIKELQSLRNDKIEKHIENEEISLEVRDYYKEMEFILDDENEFNCTILGALKLHYNSNDKILNIKRLNWLTGEFDEKYLNVNESLKMLRVFIDNSSVEIFINEGEKVISSRVYFQDNDIRINSNGKLKLNLWNYKGENINE
ncbi:sucrose-6-phosphate hydrolase [Clostridium sp. YIM B02569]|uniref:glycoside hydrolase family 32 protein n=1 Tax=Clostridium sp. YIM B02569 TaxID=2911967 RepID=UPI001EEA26DB|nr:sucrose-6-phosphate hydrolase [Clostridium sp. YIM B02569]